MGCAQLQDRRGHGLNGDSTGHSAIAAGEGAMGIGYRKDISADDA